MITLKQINEFLDSQPIALVVVSRETKKVFWPLSKIDYYKFQPAIFNSK